MSQSPPKAGARAVRVVKRLFLAATALVLLGGAGVTFFLRHQALTPVDTADNNLQEVMVPQGVTLRDMGRRLEKAGLTRNATAWRVYLLFNPPPPIKAGRHLVGKAMDVPRLAEALAGKPLSDDAPLTMVEGWRIRDADAFLAQAGMIQAGAYARAASTPQKFKLDIPAVPANLEGFLFPETYRVPVGPLDVDKLIQRQLDAFTEKFFKPYAQEIQKSQRTLMQLVTVASLLEREEFNPGNRPNIAGVIYKRLDSGKALGIDATSRYTLDHWNDRAAFLQQLRNPADLYNTRLKPGLPPSPIGAPSLPSLVAALRPVMGPYLYYLHDAQGGCHFARTADEHEANRKLYNVY
jgi:UPF0755 protein